MAGRHQNHHPDHDQGNHAVEPFALQIEPQGSAAHGADRRCRRQTQAEFEIRIALPLEGGYRGDVLRENSDAVGAVGDRAGNAHEQHDRYRQQRAATGHDVQPAGNDANGGKKDYLPDFHT